MSDNNRHEIELSYDLFDRSTARSPDEWARMYAENGFAVFPCSPIDGSAFSVFGFNQATTDLSKIQKWWLDTPDAMIGMPTGPTSGIWVVKLHVDVELNINGIAEFKELFCVEPHEVSSAIARTPGGGIQLYFRIGEGPRPSARGKMAPGITTSGCGPLRHDGGYAILPGSVTAAGGCYEWI